MTEALVEQVVPAEAEQFVIDRLTDGNTLAQAVLRLLPLAQGRITTFLPLGAVPRSLKDYGTGGKLPTPDVSEWKGTQHGDETLLMIPVPSTDSWLAAKIRSHLLRDENNVCVIEDALKRPADAVMRRLPTKFAICGDEVYHLLFPEDAHEAPILATLRAAKSSVPIFIGVLTRWPKAMLNAKPKVLSVDELQALAVETEELFVGAYDGEGYLVWSR